jgi:predicted acylesterase/phospholipase RssA
LPGLYPPVEIDGRFYVDGVLLKTLHASVALEAGIELLFAINPIVPVDLTRGPLPQGLTERQLVRRGLPTVLSQTFRTLIHSRLQVGLASYRERYPNAHILLLEPSQEDYEMFFTNIFSFSARRKVAAHAYRATLRAIRDRAKDWEPVLKTFGLRLRHELLDREDGDLWASVGLPLERQREPVEHTLRRLDRALDRLERLLGKQEERRLRLQPVVQGE